MTTRTKRSTKKTTKAKHRTITTPKPRGGGPIAPDQITLDQRQAARALGISTDTLRVWRREQRIAPTYLGVKPVYPRALVERLAAEGPPAKGSAPKSGPPSGLRVWENATRATAAPEIAK